MALFVRYEPQIDQPIEKLERQAKMHRIRFYVYTIAAIGIIVSMGIVVQMMMDAISKIQMENGVHLLVLFGVLSLINFFLIIFLWFITESSYYKMMQQFTELWMLLKNKI